MKPYRVCFVCSGNICRSPMAAAVLREQAGRVRARAPAGRVQQSRGGDAAPTLADRLVVESAGTGPWHEGEPMDPRARNALEAAGYRDNGHVARQLRLADIERYDLLVALDRRHLQTLRSMGGPATEDERLVLLRSFVPSAGGSPDVADPYYGDDAAFADCLADIEEACRGLTAQLAARFGDAPSSPSP